MYWKIYDYIIRPRRRMKKTGRADINIPLGVPKGLPSLCMRNTICQGLCLANDISQGGKPAYKAEVAKTYRLAIGGAREGGREPLHGRTRKPVWGFFPLRDK